MVIEQLISDTVKLEKIKPELMDKPFFKDSDREYGIELSIIDPPIDVNKNQYQLEDKMYPDSNRDFSEGPQWDEQEIKSDDKVLEEISADIPEEGLSNEKEISETSGSDVQEQYKIESKDYPECKKNSIGELTDEKKQELKVQLGWSDDKLKKCTMDERGIIHYKTDRCDLEGKTSDNGVLYERRMIEINKVKIEGVFPKFESAFDTQLNPNNYKSKAYAKECNSKLKETIESNLELRSLFTSEQIKEIKESRTPTGYVWHHNEEPGKMQLVKREDHDRVIGGAAHTGGNSLWGSDSVDNKKKGEHF